MSAPSSPAKQILVVDDDAPTREAIRELLEDAGFAVAEASNGRVALEVMTSSAAVSLVIMDIEMPVMTGLELLESMRAYSALASLPVVVVTGSEKSKGPFARPVVGFFKKPFPVQAFLQSVRQHVRS